jgi:hypothetical protein
MPRERSAEMEAGTMHVGVLLPNPFLLLHLHTIKVGIWRKVGIISPKSYRWVTLVVESPVYVVFQISLPDNDSTRSNSSS